MRKLIFALIPLSVLSTACHEPMEVDYFIVGDSIATQILYVTEYGIGESGCGYSAEVSCQIPLEELPGENPESFMISLVSKNDIEACTEPFPGDWDCSVVSDDYVSAHADMMAAGGPVIWVEVPPMLNNPSDPINPILAELNLEVSAALGCSLVPWEVRDAPTWEGVHYTPEGVDIAAAALDTLGLPDAC